MLRKSGFTLILFLSLSVISLVGSAKADWGPDVRLTYSGIGWLSGNGVRNIALDNIGNVHVVWCDRRDGNTEIYYKRSTDWGMTWDSVDVRLTQNPAASSSPALAIDSLGGVYITWTDRRLSSTNDIFFKRSTDRGITWNNDTLLSDTLNESWSPAIAADDSGRIHHVWWNVRPRPEKIYYRRSLDRGISWEPIRVLDSSLIADVSIEGLPEGRCYTVSGRLWFVRSTNSGSTWSPETCLTSRQPAMYPSLDATEGGHVHIVWQDQFNGPYPYYDIYYKRSENGGITWGPDTRMTFTDTLDEYTPIIEEDNSGLVHLLYQHWGIYYQHSTNGGISWESPIFLIPRLQAYNPHLAVDCRRNAHVVWDEAGDIYYKRWDPPSGIELNSTESFATSLALHVSSPVNKDLLINYNLPFKGEIEVVLYNALGQKLLILDRGKKNAGQHVVERRTNYPPGIYFLRLTSEKGTATQKVVVLR